VSWLALLLIGIAVADLAHSVRPIRIVPECVGALVALFLGLACDLTGSRDVVALITIAAIVVAWGQTVTWAFGRGGRAWVPLVLFAAAIAAALALGPAAAPADGLLGDWLGYDPLPWIQAVEPNTALLVAGALLIQMSTGNVLVRLVLEATGTINPAHHGTPTDPETRLKGGRLLGPMERLFILVLGLYGQLTAAAIVVAAKGLLRFPELQSRSEQERIHQLTEYFLVGSFASWLIALGSLVLVAG
jgi:hypothetical protein